MGTEGSQVRCPGAVGAVGFGVRRLVGRSWVFAVLGVSAAVFAGVVESVA